MLLFRTEFSKWAALFDLITEVTVGFHSSHPDHLSLNSASPTLASVETEENEQSEEFPAFLRQSNGDDDSVALEEVLVNEDGTKQRKKRKRITTRARKVIPGLSFLVCDPLDL